MPRNILPDVEQSETVTYLAEVVATVSSLNVNQTEDQSSSEISIDAVADPGLSEGGSF